MDTKEFAMKLLRLGFTVTLLEGKHRDTLVVTAMGRDVHEIELIHLHVDFELKPIPATGRIGAHFSIKKDE